MKTDSQQIRININCVKIPDITFESSFSNQEKSVYYTMENYKKDNNIARIQGQSLPVLISIDNQTPHDISDITIEISANTTAFTKSGDKSNQIINRVPLNFSRLYIMKVKEHWNGLLFDASGFQQVSIALRSLHCKINNRVEMPSFETNLPLLINADDLTNPYHGYRNEEEMQNYLLLENYIKSSFPARGLLLKFMFKTLNEITQHRSFEFEGQAISFEKEDLPALQSMLQIDIIAKVMMYLEDLIIILLAILEAYGNYYLLLDRHSKEEPDVGDRIKLFFRDKDNFSMEDWRKMLSYIDPGNQRKHSEVILKLIESNIATFRDFITNIQIFGETHHPIFRRYKHAGFPFKPGYISELSYPLTSRRFDSYCMVFTGKNPMVDVIPLPYSDDVIESYRILVPSLQRMIGDIVRSKITCIRRRADGVIPCISYSPPNAFTQQEKSEIEIALKEYNDQYPNRAYSDVYDFPLNANSTKDMKWYIDLNKNLEKWKKMKEIQDRMP